jgi:FkbM family methyltransferase
MTLDQMLAGLARRYPHGTRGWARLQNMVSPLIPQRGHRVTRVHGTQMRLDLGELTQRMIYTGLYDPVESKLVQSFLRPGDLFVDVGAQFGFYSAVALGCGARVISFEPTPIAFSAISGMGSDVRQVAIGTSQGFVTIWVNSNPKECYDPSLYQYTEGMTPLTVPIDSLDAQLANEPVVDLIKLDIEGHELAAIKGAAETLKRTRAILCEFNPRLLKLAGTSSEEVYRRLEQFGFHDEPGTVPTGDCENRFMIRAARK